MPPVDPSGLCLELGWGRGQQHASRGPLRTLLIVRMGWGEHWTQKGRICHLRHRSLWEAGVVAQSTEDLLSIYEYLGSA